MSIKWSEIDYSNGEIKDLPKKSSAYIPIWAIIAHPAYDLWAVKASAPVFPKKKLSQRANCQIIRDEKGNFSLIIPKHLVKKHLFSPIITDIFNEKIIFIQAEAFHKDRLGRIEPLPLPKD